MEWLARPLFLRFYITGFYYFLSNTVSACRLRVCVCERNPYSIIILLCNLQGYTMSSIIWTPNWKNIQFQFSKTLWCQVPTCTPIPQYIAYYNPLDDIEDLFMDDTRTLIAPGSYPVIKGEIIAMVTSLATDTNDVLRITNLLNKCTM